MRKSALILLLAILFTPQWSHSGIQTNIKHKLKTIFHFKKPSSSQNSTASEVKEKLSSCRGEVGDQLNFGLLLQNPHYQIYRASKLDSQSWPKYKNFLLEKQFIYPTKIIYLNRFGTQVTTNSSLEQISSSIFHDETHDQDPILFFPFEFTHPHHSTLPQEGKGGRDILFDILHEILTSDTHPVSIHCKDGIHRTALAALMIRYLQGGIWTETQSTSLQPSEVKRDHRKIRGGVILHNQAELEYYQFNPLSFRKENLEAIELLSHDLRFSCLKNQFRTLLNAPSTLPASSSFKACEKNNPSPNQSTQALSPSEKTRLWDSCNYLKTETDLASQIDHLEGLLKKNKKTTHQDVFDMTQYFLSIPEAQKKWEHTFFSESPNHQRELKTSSEKLKDRFCKITQEPLNFPGAHHQALTSAHENAKNYCKGMDSFDD